ncbi:hypothetical protein EST38_g10732 [Candolleomyces aberdarensis]|uniref:Uncharacterized protein n=1 Tax=Candolleomyces aberdarensis TaxID=2316362 RepID=A0A4Q2D9I3_9AGAR|nr:hypothetical protein EST38_g10732 [Candolleomyces aberdarensis]
MSIKFAASPEAEQEAVQAKSTRPTRAATAAKTAAAAKAPAAVKASAAARRAPTSIPKDSSTSKNPRRGRPPHAVAADPLVPPEDAQPTPVAAAAKKTKKGQAANKNSKPAASTPASPAQPSQKVRMMELADGVWAVMEEDDAKAMAERSAQAIRRLSDIGEASKESEGEEEFDLDVSSASDDNEDEIPATTAGIGSTSELSEIHLLRARIAQLEEIERSKGKKEKKSASNPKNKGSKNTAAAFASGLRPNYHSATSRATSQATSESRADSPDAIGGLNDSDLEDTPPTSQTPGLNEQVPTQKQLAMMARGLPRNPKRANKDVAVVAQAPGPITQQRAPTIPPRFTTPVSSLPPSRQQTPHQTTGAHQPHRPASLRRHETFVATEPVAVRAAQAVEQPSDKQRSGRKPKTDRKNANSTRTTDLPAFVYVDSKWKDVFLPTLYHAFFLSSETFLAFKSSSRKFIATVQEIIDLVFPDEGYTISGVGDLFVLVAYNRINGIRSSIAQDALGVIEKHLRDNFAGKQGEGYEWLLWACSVDYGPLFFDTPAPFQPGVSKEDPRYVFPSGRLKSPFLILVVRTALNRVNGTLKDRSLIPIGLFSIAMGALERAAWSLTPDGSVNSPVLTNFCHTVWGGAIAGYCSGFAKMSEEKCAGILALCQEIPQSVTTPTPGSTEVHIAQRMDIFSLPESPSK